MKKDYYTILGVTRDSSADDIRTAFKKLARENHPDTSDSHTTEARFQEINEAYETLGDPNKRKAYDDTLSNALITDLDAEVEKTVSEYFQKLKQKN